MKQFLQENRTFFVIATVITILALFKVGNANAQTSQAWKQMTTAQWMADIEQQHPETMLTYKHASGEKILSVCITPEGKYRAKALYLASRSASAADNFNILLDGATNWCPATHSHTKILAFQK